MARRIWKDRVVEKPRTFNVQNNADGTITLIPAPGQIVEPGTPVNATNLNGLEDDVATHLADDTAHGVGNKLDINNYVRAGAYALTAGTSTAYTITLNPAPAAYVDGQQFIILPHVDCGANPTLKVNTLAALPIVKQDGTAIAAGEIKANKPLSLVRVGSSFFIRSAGGSNIKSIQRGTSTIPSTTNTLTVNISAVDTTKAIVIRTVRNNALADNRELDVMAKLTSATTLQLTNNTALYDVIVDWQVIEFNNVKSLQTGTVSSTQTVTIAAVDLTKSMVIISWISKAPVAYPSLPNSAQLTSNTALYINAYNGNTYWQVIEFS